MQRKLIESLLDMEEFSRQKAVTYKRRKADGKNMAYERIRKNRLPGL